MKAYKTYLTVTDPKQIILSDVPFRAEEKRLRFSVLAEEPMSGANSRFSKLFYLRITQSLPKQDVQIYWHSN